MTRLIARVSRNARFSSSELGFALCIPALSGRSCLRSLLVLMVCSGYDEDHSAENHIVCSHDRNLSAF
jgi:hypothetical protein